MEKRIYVKPTTEFNSIINSTYIAASNVVIGGGEEGTEAATLLDECFMVGGYLVSNEDVIKQLGSDYTKCFYSRPDEKDNPGVIVCKDDRFKNLPRGTGVKVTYNPDNGTFTFDFNAGCGSINF